MKESDESKIAFPTLWDDKSQGYVAVESSLKLTLRNPEVLQSQDAIEIPKRLSFMKITCQN